MKGLLCAHSLIVTLQIVTGTVHLMFVCVGTEDPKAVVQLHLGPLKPVTFNATFLNVPSTLFLQILQTVTRLVLLIGVPTNLLVCVGLTFLTSVCLALLPMVALQTSTSGP